MACHPDRVTPETRYARTADGVHVAYQVVGDGPIDMVYVPGFVSHLELGWEWPAIAESYRALAEFSRLILFDKRGTGMSDRVPDDRLPDLETRMDDVRAVMDAAGSERAVILGVSEGAPMAILFAATYPGRTAGLVLVGGYARELWAPGYPWGWPEHELERDEVDTQRRWGTSELAREIAVGIAPTEAVHPAFPGWFGGLLRRSASPGAALALARMNGRIDVRAALPVIQVPTLALHRADEANAPRSRHLGESIPGARLVEFPGRDMRPGRATRTQSPGRSETSSQIWITNLISTGYWPPCCSPTSWDQPNGRPRWVTDSGEDWSTNTTRPCAVSWFVTEAGRSIPPATGFWPVSMVLRAPSDALAPSWSQSRGSDWTYGPVSIPVNVSSWMANCAGSRYTRERGSPHSPLPARCSCPAR